MTNVARSNCRAAAHGDAGDQCVLGVDGAPPSLALGTKPCRFQGSVEVERQDALSKIDLQESVKSGKQPALAPAVVHLVKPALDLEYENRSEPKSTLVGPIEPCLDLGCRLDLHELRHDVRVEDNHSSNSTKRGGLLRHISSMLLSSSTRSSFVRPIPLNLSAIRVPRPFAGSFFAPSSTAASSRIARAS